MANPLRSSNFGALRKNDYELKNGSAHSDVMSHRRGFRESEMEIALRRDVGDILSKGWLKAKMVSVVL